MGVILYNWVIVFLYLILRPEVLSSIFPNLMGMLSFEFFVYIFKFFISNAYSFWYFFQRLYLFIKFHFHVLKCFQFLLKNLYIFMVFVLVFVDILFKFFWWHLLLLSQKHSLMSSNLLFSRSDSTMELIFGGGDLF